MHFLQGGHPKKEHTLEEDGFLEKKNTKVARAGSVSLMALSLAACGDGTTIFRLV